MASESTVFAFNNIPSQITSEELSNFNPNRNSKSIFYKEVSSSRVYENISEENITFFGYGFANNYEVNFKYIKGYEATSTSEVNDLRKRIAQFLFPFHFFW